jgi:hypothetical protein
MNCRLTHENDYDPKLTDVVRVGYAEKNVEMPLSRVCHALLKGEQEKLFPLLKKDAHFADEDWADLSLDFNVSVGI